MKDTDAAWLAGFIDGEGSIMAVRYFSKVRAGTCISPSFDAMVAATNTDRRLVDRCKDIAGGSIVSVRMNRANKNWKNAYHWRLRGIAVAHVLRAVLPFLVAKRAQAELAIALREATRRGSPKGRCSTRKTPEEVAAREAVYLRMKELNARGHSTVTSENIGMTLEILRAAIAA